GEVLAFLDRERDMGASLDDLDAGDLADDDPGDLHVVVDQQAGDVVEVGVERVVVAGERVADADVADREREIDGEREADQHEHAELDGGTDHETPSCASCASNCSMLEGWAGGAPVDDGPAVGLPDPVVDDVPAAAELELHWKMFGAGHVMLLTAAMSVPSPTSRRVISASDCTYSRRPMIRGTTSF